MLSQEIKERNKLTEQINKEHDKLTKRIEREFKDWECVEINHNENLVEVLAIVDTNGIIQTIGILGVDKEGMDYNLINEAKANKIRDMWYDVYYGEVE